MDQVTATAAAAPALASSKVTETYNWGGRQRAQFDADQDAQAKATGTDKVQLGFKDMVDLVNPLQHLPIVGSIYRAVTGDDDMKPAVKTVGDTIYGGPLAGISSVFDNIVKEASGKDVMTTLANWIGIGDDNTVQTASTATASATSTVAAAATLPASAPATQTATAPAVAKPVLLASAAPLAVNTNNIAQDASVAAAANPPAPASSQLFQNLQKSASPEGQVIGKTTPKYFNPTAKQYAGVTPTAFHPSKDIANSNASIAMEANIQSSDITKAAVQSSNSVIASSTAQAGQTAQAAAQTSQAANSAQNSQSDFAQKMLAAMDRYEAAKKTGDSSDAPAVSTGL